MLHFTAIGLWKDESVFALGGMRTLGQVKIMVIEANMYILQHKKLIMLYLECFTII